MSAFVAWGGADIHDHLTSADITIIASELARLQKVQTSVLIVKTHLRFVFDKTPIVIEQPPVPLDWVLDAVMDADKNQGTVKKITLRVESLKKRRIVTGQRARDAAESLVQAGMRFCADERFRTRAIAEFLNREVNKFYFDLFFLFIYFYFDRLPRRVQKTV